MVCYVYDLYMRLVADPATGRWLIGLTGAEHEFEWDSGNLTKNRKHGVEPGDIRALIGGDFYSPAASSSRSTSSGGGSRSERTVPDGG